MGRGAEEQARRRFSPLYGAHPARRRRPARAPAGRWTLEQLLARFEALRPANVEEIRNERICPAAAVMTDAGANNDLIPVIGFDLSKNAFRVSELHVQVAPEIKTRSPIAGPWYLPTLEEAVATANRRLDKLDELGWRKRPGRGLPGDRYSVRAVLAELEDAADSALAF